VSDDKRPLDLDEIEASLDEGEIDLVPVDADRQADAAANHPQPSRAVATEDLGAIYDIPVQLSAVLGKTTMPVSQLLRLGRGAVVELDRKVGESIDILVNNRLVARGEVVVVDDRLGVTMTEIIKGDH
jgi:flagellar motor switch protein FliN/FliY